MFWGKGDSSRLEETETQTLSQLRRMVETGHIIALTPAESEVALRALRWYQMWESTFKIVASIRNTALLIGGMFTLWWVTEGRIIDFIIGLKK